MTVISGDDYHRMRIGDLRERVDSLPIPPTWHNLHDLRIAVESYLEERRTVERRAQQAESIGESDVMQFGCGDIGTAISDLCIHARCLQRTLRCEFNGTWLVATPTSTPREVCAAWDEARR